MSFENYIKFYEDYENGVTIRPQKTAEFNFSAKLEEDKNAYWLARKCANYISII